MIETSNSPDSAGSEMNVNMALLSRHGSILSLIRNCLNVTSPQSYLLPTCIHVQQMNYAKPASK